jgi:hypothetical protein
MPEPADPRDNWNRCRFDAVSRRGHYESYFQRANHPTRSLAFWIRYTIFSPRGDPDGAAGELWAIYFDGEARRITAVQEETSLSNCSFSDSGLGVRVAGSFLSGDGLEGSAASGNHEMRWSLSYAGAAEPLLLLPRSLYEGRFPQAKALVGTPNAVYEGSLLVDGERIAVDGWTGSQNHNWGSRHTDQYAWGQVAGFDNAPGAFLECSTSRVKLGPLWTPWLTLLVLRLDGREFALNSLPQALRARGRYESFDWFFDSRTREVRIRGRIQAPASSFVGLRYRNPPGGMKTCFNCKIAGCEIVLERRGEEPRTLRTTNRAAFEILTDARDHGSAIRLAESDPHRPPEPGR